MHRLIRVYLNLDGEGRIRKCLAIRLHKPQWKRRGQGREEARQVPKDLCCGCRQIQPVLGAAGRARRRDPTGTNAVWTLKEIG